MFLKKENGKGNWPGIGLYLCCAAAIATALLWLMLPLLTMGSGGAKEAWEARMAGEGDMALDVSGLYTGQAEEEDYIHWVELHIPLQVLEQALKYDTDSHGKDAELSWIELMAYAAAKNGGKFPKGKRSPEIDKLAERLQGGEAMEDITKDMRYYAYYHKAYTAIFKEFVGEFADGKTGETRYGLKAFSPIAKGFGFGHYDDFGNPRTYGYKRLHLGNDLTGAIGTPIIAVAGGRVAALGWNEYGGWRVGIRSTDGLRYYYYAHLRKDTPYAEGLAEGDTVRAGDVIGYMGMTGYSKKENVNNIDIPHLHFGLQLIFDESQAEGVNQIWVDVYQIVRLLERNRVPVMRPEGGKGYVRADGLVVGSGGSANENGDG